MLAQRVRGRADLTTREKKRERAYIHTYLLNYGLRKCLAHDGADLEMQFGSSATTWVGGGRGFGRRIGQKQSKGDGGRSELE
jgi:hypothetical protein